MKILHSKNRFSSGSVWSGSFCVKAAVLFCLLLSAPFLLLSCGEPESASSKTTATSGNGSGTSENGTEKPHYDFCRLIGTINLPEEFSGTGTASRAAIPDTTGYVYKVRVFENDIYHDYNESYYNENPIQVIDGKFEVPLPTNKPIMIRCGIGQPTGNFMTFSTDSEFFTLPGDCGVYYKEFNLQPPEQEHFGSVDLTINVPDGVYYAVINSIFSKNGNTINNMEISAEGEAGSRVVKIISGSEVGWSPDSDIYEVTIKFYDDGYDTFYNTGGTLLYATTQTLCIYDYTRTNRWVSGNTADGPIDENGNFTITQEMIDRFKRTKFYVGKGSLTGVTANDSNEGSPYSPFATCAAAVNAIVANNNPNEDYTIYINGNCSVSPIAAVSCTLGANLDGKAKSITLCGLNGLSNDGIPKDSITGSHNSYNIVTVTTSVPVFIKNLKIGRTSAITTAVTSPSSSGVSLGTNAFVTMESGTLIQYNASHGVDNQGIFIMKGGEISNNRTGTASNKNGAGVYNLGIFSMEGGVIKGNTVGDSANSSFGGGVYNAGKFYMSGDSIIGEVLQGNPTYENFSGNHSNRASRGGGIYNHQGNISTVSYTGEVYLGYKYDKTNDTKIESLLTGGIYYNCAVGIGGGIYNFQGATVEISSGNISGNLATSSAGGIYNYTGSTILRISGGTVRNNYGSNATNDESKRKGGIVNEGIFEIKGSPNLEKQSVFDHIYLEDSKIQITGNMTLPEGASAFATIVPKTYATTTQVFTDTSSPYLSAVYDKFLVLDDTSASKWTISNSGYLKGLIGTKAPLEAKEVGDIIFTDGSALPESSASSITEAQKNAAIAVIFYVGTGLNNDGETGTRTLGVGIKHKKSRTSWCSVSAKAYSTNISGIVGTSSSGVKNGSNNFNIIAQTLGSDNDTNDLSLYPAFAYAINYKQNFTTVAAADSKYKESWYLPSAAELYKLYEKKSDVNTSIEACGGDIFETNSYWSASQNSNYAPNANIIQFYNGGEQGNGVDKKSDYTYFVCAIHEF